MTISFVADALVSEGDKRIMEMSDTVSTGRRDQCRKALLAQSFTRELLTVSPPLPDGNLRHLASSVEGKGLDKIAECIADYMKLTRENGYFRKKRSEQAVYWMRESIDDFLLSRFYGNTTIKKMLPEVERKVREGETDSFHAASELLNLL